MAFCYPKKTYAHHMTTRPYKWDYSEIITVNVLVSIDQDFLSQHMNACVCVRIKNKLQLFLITRPTTWEEQKSVDICESIELEGLLEGEVITHTHVVNNRLETRTQTSLLKAFRVVNMLPDHLPHPLPDSVLPDRHQWLTLSFVCSRYSVDHNWLKL